MSFSELWDFKMLHLIKRRGRSQRTAKMFGVELRLELRERQNKGAFNVRFNRSTEITYALSAALDVFLLLAELQTDGFIKSASSRASELQLGRAAPRSRR